MGDVIINYAAHNNIEDYTVQPCPGLQTFMKEQKIWSTEATEAVCSQEHKVVILGAKNCHISQTFVSNVKYDSFIFSCFDRCFCN